MRLAARFCHLFTDFEVLLPSFWIPLFIANEYSANYLLLRQSILHKACKHFSSALLFVFTQYNNTFCVACILFLCFLLILWLSAFIITFSHYYISCLSFHKTNKSQRTILALKNCRHIVISHLIYCSYRSISISC